MPCAKRAYLFAREMVWKKAAQGYMESFARVRSDRLETPRVQFSAGITIKSLNHLPELKLNHVNALTDDTGMLQHAIFTIPNRAEGYTTDDNARALIFAVLLRQAGNTESAQSAIGRSAIWHSSSTPSIRRKKGSETSLATTAIGWKNRARKILTVVRCGLLELSWLVPRIRDCGVRPGVCSNSLCQQWSGSTVLAPALTLYSECRSICIAYPGDRDAQRVRLALAQRLLDMYESVRRPEWKWFEDVVAYGNARLPQAMLLAGSACSNERMLSAGLDSLDWLMEHAALPGQWPLCADRLARVLSPRRRTGSIRPTAH